MDNHGRRTRRALLLAVVAGGRLAIVIVAAPAMLGPMGTRYVLAQGLHRRGQIHDAESTIPSSTFIDALDQHGDAEALHTYIAGHITYWMPGAARGQAPEHPVLAHPGADADFAEKNGHGLSEEYEKKRHGLSEEDKKKRPGTWGVAMQSLRE
ncbi:hypothetical protein AYO21_09265 [Fonsecaea monophora]|uniref:Uncharacterized protein n=1 Tax=Fonsecaea monophora TaxID=254056 RepID=A0A177EWV0_9EURO|nr:hypothetical protein AYO21_09265 [Fonsecaea monophora]OAG36534.1 hypothetical protein AYO21_09265 [Fonsecaea monophora]